MRSYSVHGRPDEPPERFAFVKDGFSWPALFVPLLWLLWHRLWLTLVGYVIFILVVAWTGRLIDDDMATLVAILGSILFALEANNIRRLSLEGSGRRELGVGAGRNLEEAELRFFDRWSGQTPAMRTETAGRPMGPPQPRSTGGEEPVLGSFPEPER